MSYEIGTTYAGMAALSALATAVPDPKSNMTDHSQRILLGNGKQKGMGWRTAEWRWTYLTRAQRDQLKTFCTGASADVYIKTRKNDTEDTEQVYTAIMIWPQGEEKSYSKRMDFVIRFVDLQEYTP